MDVKSTDLTRQYHQQDQQTDCTPPKYTGFIGVMSQVYQTAPMYRHTHTVNH